MVDTGARAAMLSPPTESMPRTGQPAFRLVGAVQRAFNVLDALAEADTELGTNEIARRTGINASSVSRLLATGPASLPPGQLKAYTERTITQRAALAEELEGVRDRGYAYNFGEREHDLHAIAAPVWGSRSELAAIIGVQGPASRFTPEEMEAAVAPLLEQTAALSSELGWTGFVQEGLQS